MPQNGILKATEAAPQSERARSCQALEIIFVEMFQIKDKNKKLYTTLSSFLSLCVCVRARKNCSCGVGAGQSRPVFDTMRQQQQPVRRHQDESSPVGLGSQPASQSVWANRGWPTICFPHLHFNLFFFPLWFFLTHISRRHNFGNCVKCVKRRAAAGKTCHLLFL